MNELRWKGFQKLKLARDLKIANRTKYIRFFFDNRYFLEFGESLAKGKV